MLKKEFSNGASLIIARYVLAIKSDKEKEERYKKRCVAGGLLGVMKDYLVQGEHTSQLVSACIILVVAKIKGFRVWVVDVKLAYLNLISHR